MCDYGTNSQPRGIALVVVMLVMAILLLAGTTFLTISSTESQIALNQRASAQAFGLAEAALHKALAQLTAASLAGSIYSRETGALAGGTFAVAVTAAALQTCPGNTAKDLVTQPAQTIGDTVRGVGNIFGTARATMNATDPHGDRIIASVTGGASARRKQAFISLISIISIMGVAVGFIALSVLLPILEMSQIVR